jgi:outer membrane lipase/esterase
LFCTADTLIAGDTSRYEFADGVHPSPYGYQLYAQAVALQMARAGWL